MIADSIEGIQNIFSNIEIANIFWLSVIMIIMLFSKSVRASITVVLKVFFDPKIFTLFAGALIYTAVIVYILHKLYFWDWFLLKDTIIWFVITAFVLLLNANKAGEERYWFKKVFRENLGVAAFMEFLNGFNFFGLAFALILVPVITVFQLLNVVAKTKEEHAQLSKFLESLLGYIGIGMAFFFIYKIASNIEIFANFNNSRTLFLPPILTTTFLPFIYLFALIMVYENIFIRLHFGLDKDKSLIRYTKQTIVKTFCFNLKRLNKFSKKHAIYLKQIHNEKDIFDIIQRFKTEEASSK